MSSSGSYSSVRTTRARRLEAAVEERRADHGLQRVGEDRRAAHAAALQLALAEPQVLAEIEAPRQLAQATARARGSRAGATARLRSESRKRVYSSAATTQLSDAVAEELEALVVWSAVAAVGQRLREQLGRRGSDGRARLRGASMLHDQSAPVLLAGLARAG